MESAFGSSMVDEWGRPLAVGVVWIETAADGEAYAFCACYLGAEASAWKRHPTRILRVMREIARECRDRGIVRLYMEADHRIERAEQFIRSFGGEPTGTTGPSGNVFMLELDKLTRLRL